MTERTTDREAQREAGGTATTRERRHAVMPMSNESMNAMDNIHRERRRRSQPIPVAPPPADAQQAGYDAVEAQREPGQSDAERVEHHGIHHEADAEIAEMLRDLRADVTRVQGFNKEFQDENTRLEGERDALAAALRGTRANLRWMYAGVCISEGDMEVIRGRLSQADTAIAALAKGPGQ